MGWLDDQIQERIQQDDAMFSSAFVHMADVVMGKQKFHSFHAQDTRALHKALYQILDYYQVVAGECSWDEEDSQVIIDELLRPSQLMKRRIQLTKTWYKHGMLPLLVMDEENHPYALIPHVIYGYYYISEEGKSVRVTKHTAERFQKNAYGFYKPLPFKKLKRRDVIPYLWEMLKGWDFFLFIATLFMTVVLGLLTPILYQYLYAKVVAFQSVTLLMTTLSVLICMSLSIYIHNIIKRIVLTNLEERMHVSLEAAMMMRLLHLPTAFFKKLGAGELASRIDHIARMSQLFISVLLSAVLTACFSMMYIIQAYVYAPSLARVALLFIVCSMLLNGSMVWFQVRQIRKEIYAQSKETNMVYTLLSGIQKIKNAGSEKRAFAKWAHIYHEHAYTRYHPPLFLKIYPVLSSAIVLSGMITLFYTGAKHNLDASSYMAFVAAYGMVSGAFLQLGKALFSASVIVPMLDMLLPMLEEVPEYTGYKYPVRKLNGGIELDNISFRYQEQMPFILDNLSLKIKAGQYVAIVGETGCGKSTFMRMLLGFEKPNKGAIYFDGKDMDTLDIADLRKHMGVVLQDGKLFQGDIYSNITISAPWMSLDDAWEAARLAGMKEDIEHMPMNMFTLISEGSGGISGGQRQRILIARAIAPKPNILLFDEATSALDNVSQKQVSDALDHLKCTRIVIAHRLSTIRHCDRILVLHQGKFIEDGTYEELIKKDGFFASLVARQQIHT